MRLNEKDSRMGVLSSIMLRELYLQVLSKLGLNA